MGGKKYIAAILAGTLIMSSFSGAVFANGISNGHVYSSTVSASASASAISSVNELYIEAKPVFENDKVFILVSMKNFKKHASDIYGVQFNLSYGDNIISSYEFTDFKNELKSQSNQDKKFISVFNNNVNDRKVTIGLVGDYITDSTFDDDILLVTLELDATKFKDSNMKIEDIIVIDNKNYDISSRLNMVKSCAVVSVKKPVKETSEVIVIPSGGGGTPSGGGTSTGGGGVPSGGGASTGGGGVPSGGGAPTGNSNIVPPITSTEVVETKPQGNLSNANIKIVVKEEKTVAVEVAKKIEIAPFKEEIKLEIDANTFNAPVDIKVSKIDSEKSEIKMEATSDKTTKLKKFSEVYDFDAKGSTFKKPVAVTFAYNVSSEIDEEKLGVYTLNESTGTWDFVGGQVDSKNNTITAELKHFSKYSVMLYDKTFEDIKGHWAKNNIEFFAAKHMASGVSEKQFDPDGNVTRAQFVTLLVKAFGMEKSKSASCFKDVNDGEWYKDYVMTAKEAGITNGTSKDEFEPDATITREQMATMIMNAYNVLGKCDYKAETIEKSNFNDESKISDWAKKAIDAAKSKGIVNGYDTSNFAPKMTATRAQAVTMIKKLYDMHQ